MASVAGGEVRAAGEAKAETVAVGGGLNKAQNVDQATTNICVDYVIKSTTLEKVVRKRNLGSPPQKTTPTLVD